MYTGETQVDEKGRVAVSITTLFIYRGVIHCCAQEECMYMGEMGVDEKGGVAVRIMTLFAWLSILIKPSMFSIQTGDTQLRSGGPHVHG